MIRRPSICRANTENAAELQRVLRICLAGMRAPGALTFPGGEFGEWVRRHFLPVQAPHAIAVHRMVLSGNSAGILAADAALTLPGASSEAGRELLSRRDGARHLPVIKRLIAAVASGEMPGHFITVIALYAADFSIGELPLLQSALYCEWCTAQPAGATLGLSEFLNRTGDLVSSAGNAVVPDFGTAPARLRAL